MGWFDHKRKDEEIDELHRIEKADEQIARDMDLLVEAELHYPMQFAIHQISPNPHPSGDHAMSTSPVLPQILGITLGNIGTFNTIVTAPAGASFPSGTTFVWTSSDPLTTLTPSADTTTVAIATTASDTAASFVLTCVSSFTPTGASAPLQATATVPLTAAVVTPPNTPSAFAINQIS